MLIEAKDNKMNDLFPFFLWCSDISKQTDKVERTFCLLKMEFGNPKDSNWLNKSHICNIHDVI